uniref:Retroviral polymerase SH3-like domain-containing protein n=1 Tax=Chenopodium quinoa TaxID=63459 RepID=A0A803LZ91_CHEQI
MARGDNSKSVAEAASNPNSAYYLSNSDVTTPKLVNRIKLDPRAVPYVFLGYHIAQKGYKVLNLTTNKIVNSRDIQFHVKHFPFHFSQNPSSAYSTKVFLPELTDMSAVPEFSIPNMFTIDGYVPLFGKSPISWKSKKQATLSKSSSEAEYRAMAQAASETTCIVSLLEELEYVISDLFCFIVTINHQYILQGTPFFMKGQNILTLIVVLKGIQSWKD